MITYLDKILYLYPNIQNVMYWSTQYDGTAWNDLYDGIVWENTQIEKPTKATLDGLDDAIVEIELQRRVQQAEIELFKKDIQFMSNYENYKINYPETTIEEYVAYLQNQ